MTEKLWNATKIGVTIFFTAINKNLACIYVLFGLNILDYITGLMAAPFRGEPRDSYKGIKGIFKKVSILLLVAVGAVIDYMIAYASQSIGLDLPIKLIIANATAIWLCCNEILSVLENVADMDVALPEFLIKIVATIKHKTEEQAIDEQEQEQETK